MTQLKGVIYTLCDPRDSSVHYIGKTKRTIEIRLREHINDKKNTFKTRWIKELKLLNLIPEIKIIKEVNLEDLHLTEIMLICEYKLNKHPIKNSLSGLYRYR